MGTTTAKGVPYPVSGDNNNVPGDMLGLANWLDANLPHAPAKWVKLRRVAAHSIGGSLTDITWDTEDSDTSGFIAVPAITLTVPAGAAGWYMMGYQYTWSSNPGPGGYRLYFNGGTDIVSNGQQFTTGSGLGIYGWLGPVYMAVGDTIKSSVFQTNSATLTGRFMMSRICD